MKKKMKHSFITKAICSVSTLLLLLTFTSCNSHQARVVGKVLHDVEHMSDETEALSDEDSYSTSGGVDREYIELLESQIANINRQLPTDIGSLSYFHVELDKETATLIHYYQFPNNPTITQEQIDVAKAAAIAALKNSPTERAPIDNGLTMRYKYYSRNQELLYTITITQDDLY